MLESDEIEKDESLGSIYDVIRLESSPICYSVAVSFFINGRFYREVAWIPDTFVPYDLQSKFDYISRGGKPKRDLVAHYIVGPRYCQLIGIDIENHFIPILNHTFKRLHL